MKKNRMLIIFSGGVLLLLTLFSGCGEHSGEKAYSKAMAAWERNDLVRAQSQMEKAIRKLSGDENKAEANNRLGIILWQLGKRNEAIECFTESCRLSNDISGSNLNLGISLYHAAEFERANFELTNILMEQPENVRARLYLGMVHLQQKEWKTAYDDLTTALRANPDDAAGHNALALAELHLNRSSDASIKRLKQLLAAYPDYAPAIYNLAVIYDQWLRNPDVASGWYKQYLQKAGADGQYIEDTRQAIARLNSTNKPAQTPSQTATTDPKAAARYVNDGIRLHAAKKYDEAVKMYIKAITADLSMVDAHYNLGLSYYELKKYREAVQTFDEALKLDPDYINARYMKALSYARIGDWSNATREASVLKKSDAARAEAVLNYIAEARKR